MFSGVLYAMICALVKNNWLFPFSEAGNTWTQSRRHRIRMRISRLNLNPWLRISVNTERQPRDTMVVLIYHTGNRIKEPNTHFNLFHKQILF